MGDSGAVRDMTTVDKKDPERDGSTSSPATTPEPDPETFAQENPQIQKRKGGRKPIYATSEERKQRNCQAQAAFRERRTEYIKQLESTIKHHEETLQSLQQSHRSAADECLMLRYKNSLLERILLEKGIDVQAELQAKTGSPTLGPQRTAHSATTSPAQGPMQQRAIMNRHQQARRSIASMPPKAEGLQNIPINHAEGVFTERSPGLHPTPASQTTSPSTTSTRSPNFVPQAQSGINSPNFGPLAAQHNHSHQQHTLRSPQQPRSHFNHMPAPQRPPLMTSQTNSSSLSSASGAGSALSSSTNASGGPHSYYAPSFQSHMDQLDQEYDAQADILEEQETNDHPAGTGPFPHPFSPAQPNMPQQAISHSIPPNAQQPQQSPVTLQQGDTQGNGQSFAAINNFLDPYDPMLDADPFGLSASMHFPTQFSYESR